SEMDMMNEQEFIMQADRYLNSEMDSHERIAFEQYCQENAAAAEQLATHRMFLQQIKDHADRVAFKNALASAAKKYHGAPSQPVKCTEPLVITLWNKFKINSLVAASVAIVA